jgi:hypothetical protein
MKVKLLKEIRKDFKFKYKHDHWHVLSYGYSRKTYLTFESALTSVLEALSFNHTKLFDWPWHGIKQQYIIKTQTRKFNKL